MTLDQLSRLFVEAGCTKLYAKPLAENDNSKNQVYFGPDFQSLNLFPNAGIVAGNSSANPIFKAQLSFGWLLANGNVVAAPGAQLILYPQYPEVRFSGFLRGCASPPSNLMVGRSKGRVLFIGVTARASVVGFVVDGNSPSAHEFQATSGIPTVGVFHEIPLPTVPDAAASRTILLAELGRIHRLGWIASKQLDSSGVLRDCNASQCGGFTLEAELNIAKNSQAEPDFHGWEVKQHAVSNFDRPESAKAITLMTPEPDGGFYVDYGVVPFIRRYGYPDRNNVVDRLNFGGRHSAGLECPATRLTMELRGYDTERERIADADGSIALVSASGEVAASWSFRKVLEHWSRKHAKAVYVPSNCRTDPSREYRYGHRVRLAQKTDALRLLKAFASRAVYYDPGIKLECASGPHPTNKKRSQFRVASRNIDALYESVEVVSV